MPLEEISKQQSKYVLKATFYKMKADYLRYIFECLHGDNGIFFKDPRPPKKDGYNAYLDERKANEVNDFFIQANLRESEISCELSDKDFHISSNK